MTEVQILQYSKYCLNPLDINKCMCPLIKKCTFHTTNLCATLETLARPILFNSLEVQYYKYLYCAEYCRVLTGELWMGFNMDIFSVGGGLALHLQSATQLLQLIVYI